jgi:hypothetical protein
MDYKLVRCNGVFHSHCNALSSSLFSFMLKSWPFSFWCSVSHSFLLLWVLCFFGGSFDGVQRFQENETGFVSCVIRTSLSLILPFSCWAWIDLDVQFCGGAHHDPVVITLCTWGCHFSVYVPMSFVWKWWCSLFFKM